MQSVKQRLYQRPTAFDFFQAVMLLETELSSPHDARPPIRELLRFKTQQSLTFPSSSLRALLPEWTHRQRTTTKPHLFINFYGLTGPQGALPSHYTNMLMRLGKREPGREILTSPLQEWFDLFNHEMIAFFYQAWEKYRFPVSYFHHARREEAGYVSPKRNDDHDRFSNCMLALIGMGVPSLHNRLHVKAASDLNQENEQDTTLASINDLALIRHSALLAKKPRSMVGLVTMLQQYFGWTFEIKPFSGQWLTLDLSSQAKFEEPCVCRLGENVVAGERIWDLNSMFKVRIGPLHYREFIELLPDTTPVPDRKAFFLVSQLIRYYVGLELDFEMQLSLYGEEVPDCVLQEVPDGTLGARLGWNTWLTAEKMPYQVDEAIFPGDERTQVEPSISI